MDDLRQARNDNVDGPVLILDAAENRQHPRTPIPPGRIVPTVRMDSKTGFLYIADISGYSMYLGASELEHARDTLGALLEVLVEGTRPPLTISKLEGDAVFSYSEDTDLLVGQTLVEMIENCYLAFRRVIDLMVLNNTCGCRACTNVSGLDLKFFVHHGEFATQDVGAHHELLGNDVVLTHRLLKNPIVERTGIRAYTAYTDAALERLGPDLAAEMTRVDTDYPDIGEITMWVEDMHPVWEARKDEDLVNLTPAQTYVDINLELDVPVEIAWDYLADVEFRKVFIGSDRQEVLDRQQGRVAVGSTYQCYHGDRMVTQVVLEWKPFERIVTRDRIDGVPGGLFVLSVFELAPSGNGTLLNYKAGGFEGPFVFRALGPLVLRAMRRQFVRDGEKFRQAIEADYGRRSGERVSSSL